MESPPASSDHGDVNFDPARPFNGIVVCCTSIPPEQRTDVASKTAELGGVHKYDLTPDVTHLIVGDYDTAKYRHVAKERPDIKPMALGWVEAVRSLWTEDADIDFSALEKAWSLKPLETHGGEPATQSRRGIDRGKLLCCLTGFDDADERQRIIDKIHANGGSYTGDLTRQVTHLVVARPEGRKYTAAKTWNVHTVSVEWLDDSAARGMILDEKCYDPTLPKEDRGKNAWLRRDPRSSSLAKRLRDPSAAQEEGRRKLRKTASMKLNSQRDDLWGNILGKGLPSAGPNRAQGPGRTESRPDEALEPRQDARSSPGSDQTAASLAQPGPTSGLPFSSCSFFVHGFSKAQTEILLSTVSSHGGQSVSSLGDLVGNPQHDIQHRLVIVPQNSSSEAHPSVPEEAHLVTEFFIERCMHKKRFFSPGDDVIGRPFPVFPIPGFEKLGICTAGFTGVDLNQVDKAIRQLGARYEERFTAQTSMLVCTSLETVRRQKLDLAIVWRVPVVKASWLWTCITTGSMLPIRSFMFPSLRQSDMAPWESEQGQKTQPLVWDRHPDPIPQPPKASSGNSAQDSHPAADPGGHKDISSHPPRFETAPTHQSDSKAPSEDRSQPSSRHSAPLSELSANNINRSASPPKPTKTTRKPLSRMPSEIADSETAGDAESDEDRANGEATQKHLEQQKVAADERLALSTRLTSLLEATPGGGTGRSGSESCARDDNVSTSAAATAKAPRRKRGIMGRAISNVSATSSGSVDSAATATVATTASRTITAAAQLLLHQEIPDDSDKTKLSLTQVEYEAPDAQRYKAQLLSKMMGKGGSLPPEQRPEEKLTMRDYQQAIQAEKSYAAGSGVTATRRTTRRRQ